MILSENRSSVVSRRRGLAGLDFDLTSLLSTGLQTYGAIETSKATAAASKSAATAAAAQERAAAARAAAASSGVMAYAKPVLVIGGAALAGWFLVRSLRKGRR